MEAARYPKQDNPNWPLPPQYHTLDELGRRAARLSVIRMRETPEDDVASWHVFRNHYLSDDVCAWYDMWTEPAPGHYEWVYNAAKYDRLVMGAHRGSAKSTIMRELILRDLVSTPYLGPRGWVIASDTLLIQSTDDAVEESTDRLMIQIDENPKIIADFGALHPEKGRGQWNIHKMRLSNKSRLRAASAGSRGLRGRRPHVVVLDDIEYDPKENTSIERLISEGEHLLFFVVLPMLRRGSRMRMIGTPLKRQMLLWRLTMNEDVDPRLDSKRWHRAIYPGILADGTPFWPSEYRPQDIEDKRRELGAAFSSEFLCSPGQDHDKPFAIHLEGNSCKYRLSTGDDPASSNTPLDSTAIIAWEDADRNAKGEVSFKKREESAGKIFRSMTRVITVDACRKPSPTSDWSVVHTIGCDRLSQMWSLDLYSQKVRYEVLTGVVWDYVKKWSVRVVGVESVSMELFLYYQLVSQAQQFSERFGWVPAIVPITYSRGVDKSSRIQTLEGRFSRGLIKLPEWRRFTGAYRQLFTQIEEFDGDCENLDHDDAIDTLTMAQDLVKGNRRTERLADAPLSAIERLKKGEVMNEVGIPLGLAVDWGRVDPTELDAIIKGRSERVEEGNKEERTIKWTRHSGSY